MRYSTILKCILVLPLLWTVPVGAQDGPGIENVARPAGTLLSHFQVGGRMATFHRGYFYVMGQQKTTLWDVSSFTDPEILSEQDIGDNGHRWWKFNGDMFWREYSVPEIEGSGYHFMDMSDMQNIGPWTDDSVPMPITEDGQNTMFKWQALETWPTGTLGGNIHDSRFNSPGDDIDITSMFDTGNLSIDSMQRFRIGNLLFITATESAGNQGLAVLDIGDPENVVPLDEITCQCNQYTTTYHVWGDHFVTLDGSAENEGGANMVTIDFSDPTDLKMGEVALPPEVVSTGRYMYFQDEYGFAGDEGGQRGAKVNMETGELVQEFTAPSSNDGSTNLLDYQWMPLGAVVAATGDNGNGRTFFYQHQDQPDTRGPEVRFHHPFADSTGNPVSTVIGFAIPEMIDERTANNDNIQLRPVGGGEQVMGDFTWSSYQVLNFIPRQMLEPDTTYEMRFVEGGLKDVAGNGIEAFSFFFSTGDSVNANEAPTVDSLDFGSGDPVGVGENVTFTAAASDFEGDPIEYRWSLDGDSNTAWSTSNTFSTSFETTGVHSVSVQVRDDQGGISVSAVNVVVVESTTASTASHSGPLALDAAGRRLWVVNPDNDSLAMIDADSLEKTGEVSVCADPTGVAVDANSQVWVACRDGDAVQVRDAGDGGLIATIDTGRGSRPFGVVVNPSGSTVFVSENGSGELTKIDAVDRSITATLNLGPKPRAMAMSPDGGRLLVTRFISEDAGGTVWDVDPAAMTVNGEITLPLDSTTLDSGTAARGVPNYLAGVAVSPSGDNAVVVGKKDNIERGLARDGNPLSFETTVRNAIATLDLNAGSEVLDQRVDIDNHAQPSAVAFSPFGSHIFVTMQGNNRVAVLDPGSGNEIGRADVGLAPQGVLVDPETNRVFVKNFMGRSVTVLDADTMLTGGGTSLTELATIDTVNSESLSSEVLLGKQIFYNARDERMALEGYLTCATCHIDGDEDGRTWDFTDRGEGFRNTIALRGRAGTGHGRVHWTANFDEIHDFENDIRGPFAGQGFLSDADFESGSTSDPLGDPKAGLSSDLDALAAYVSSLDTFDPSPYRNNDGSLTAEGEAGRALFESQGCAGCHGGQDFTDSDSGFMHDVGTIGADSGSRRDGPLLGIDTPTLRDVWDTAPYLHDGSAATLQDVLTNNADDAHGSTSSLSSTEINQLAAYLRQIDGSEPAFTGQGINLAITSVADGESVREGSIPLAISTDLSGVSEVTYYADGEAIASSTSGPSYSTSWEPPQLGDYLLQARAVYNNGNTASLTPELAVNFGGSNDCNVQYEIANDWGAGFQAGVTVTNNGETEVAGYELVWDLGDGEQFSSGWNATFSSEGSTVTATVPAGNFNGTLAPNGGTSSFGFQATNSSPPAGVPGNFTLNGTSCSVGDQPDDPDNNPPQASFSTTASGLMLNADASGSSDSDGDSLSYSWEFGDGATGSGQTASHNYGSSGTYTVTLTVSDGTDSDTATSDVTVSGGNSAPQASFTSSTSELDVSVDGAGSSDPDGDSLSYSWDFGDGSSASGQTASHSYGSAGTYTVTLTVSDGSDSDTATADVTVQDGNSAPQASFSASTGDLDVSVDASGSSDPDGDTLSYSWDFGDGNTGSGRTASHTYSSGGSYTITLTVSDGTADDTATSSVSVSPADQNEAPSAAADASPASGDAPLDVTFNASGSTDPDGDSLSYSWDFGDGSTASGANPTHTYSSAGSYTATVTVSDGELDDTADVTVEVSEPDNDGGELGCSLGDVNDWGSGFVMGVNVTNDSDSSVGGWRVTLEFGGSVTVTNSWNASLEADGSTVTAENMGYNGNLGTGQGTNFGFQGTLAGGADVPTGCTAEAL